METQIKRISTKDIISYLVEKFPACFSLKGPVKPLKVGIFQDLAEKLDDDETISKTRLRQALRHYTSSWRYLKAIKVGAFRVDIEGNDVAEIDEEQAKYASKTLKESQEKFGNNSLTNKKPQEKGDKKPLKSIKIKALKQLSVMAVNSKLLNRPSVQRVKKELPLLKQVDSATINIGSKVKVQLGNAPMNATITEIAGKDVSVQLDSGMTIKTQMQNIYS
ncbi:RNA chaperone ProQ [Colwellia sp. MSW7]|uniref:RNA chaperone ProQ n=1 Tax=Colwellia maritima TaxID=2912588 RepID=A0ABS9X534_9GAMM|nr:RNA chaperone ProQ [Colwellia maritima]MCI2284147.1 RNA chaperone ProQ [Colwellia maritima]